MKWYVIDDEKLAVLRKISSRLHTEDRLDGDEMRDLGHAIEGVVRICEQIEME